MSRKKKTKSSKVVPCKHSLLGKWMKSKTYEGPLTYSLAAMLLGHRSYANLKPGVELKKCVGYFNLVISHWFTFLRLCENGDVRVWGCHLTGTVNKYVPPLYLHVKPPLVRRRKSGYSITCYFSNRKVTTPFKMFVLLRPNGSVVPY